MTDATVPGAPAAGPRCADCDRDGLTWVHLRRCVACGRIGCCDQSPGRHATEHARSTGHDVIRSVERDESWSWDYGSQRFVTPPDAR